MYSLTDDAESLSYLFRYIEESFAGRDLEAIDLLLIEFIPSRCKPILATGLLRCSNRAKHLLPNWVICRDSVHNYLESIGEDPTSLLRGLY